MLATAAFMTKTGPLRILTQVFYLIDRRGARRAARGPPRRSGRRGVVGPRRWGCFKTCFKTIGKTLKHVLNPVIMIVGQTLTCKSNRYSKNRAPRILPQVFFPVDRWGARIAARSARSAAAPRSAAASWGRGVWVVLKHGLKQPVKH